MIMSANGLCCVDKALTLLALLTLAVAGRAVANNSATLHIQKLLVHVLRLVRQVHASPQRAPAATSALYFARTVVCHLTETQVRPHEDARLPSCTRKSPPRDMTWRDIYWT